jgi:hypothetical protein
MWNWKTQPEGLFQRCPICVEACVVDRLGREFYLSDINRLGVAETEGFEPSIPLWGMLI